MKDYKCLNVTLDDLTSNKRRTERRESYKVHLKIQIKKSNILGNQHMWKTFNDDPTRGFPSYEAQT